MSDIVKNVRIIYSTDGTGLGDANKGMAALTAEEQKTVKAFQDTNKAATQQIGLIEKLAADEKKLLDLRNKSTDPAQIRKYNDQIAATQKQTKDLQKTTKELGDEGKKQGNLLTESFKGVGIALAAAFTVDAIVAFGKASKEEYNKQLEAEAQLLVALDGRVQVQKRLISEAGRLQEAINIPDEVIINQQAFLAGQGKTEAEIKKTIQAAAELSAYRKIPFETALQQLSATTETLTAGKLSKLSSDFKDLTKEQLANGGAIDLVLEKYAGFAEEAAKTGSGPVKQLEIQFGELQETTGLFITNLLSGPGAFTSFVKGLNSFIGSLAGGLRSVQQIQAAVSDKQAATTFNTVYGFITADLEKFRTNGLIKTKDELISFYETQKILTQNSIDVSKKDLKALEGQVAANEKIAEQRVGEDVLGLKSFNKKKEQDEFALARQKGVIAGQQQVLQDLEANISHENDVYDKNLELAKKRAEERQKLLDKEFSAQLASLAKQEDIAKRRNKLDGGGTTEDLQIQASFNQKRLNLYVEYGKQRTDQFESLELTAEEIEQKLTDFTLAETKKRADEQEKLTRDLEADYLKTLDQTLQNRSNKNSEAAQNELQGLRSAYQSGLIDRGTFNKELESLNYKAQHKQLEDELVILKEKAETEESFQKDVIAKQKQINDLEFEQFQKNEDDKIKAVKEAEVKKQALRQEFLQAASSIVSSYVTIQDNGYQQDLQNSQYAQQKALAQAGDDKNKQAAINARFTKEQNKIKHDQAVADKTAALFSAGINIIQAESKALASAPFPENLAFVALTAIEGAAQIAAIQSRPIPKFFKGTEWLQRGGNPAGIDTIPAMLNEGERVVPTHINKMMADIPNNALPDIIRNYRMNLDTDNILSGGKNVSVNQIEITNELKSINKNLSNLKQLHVSIDKNGVETWLQNAYSKTVLANNYFRT